MQIYTETLTAIHIYIYKYKYMLSFLYGINCAINIFLWLKSGSIKMFDSRSTIDNLAYILCAFAIHITITIPHTNQGRVFYCHRICKCDVHGSGDDFEFFPAKADRNEVEIQCKLVCFVQRLAKLFQTSFSYLFTSIILLPKCMRENKNCHLENAVKNGWTFSFNQFGPID